MWTRLARGWLRKCNTCSVIKPLNKENFMERWTTKWLFRYKCLDCNEKLKDGFKSNSLSHWMSSSKIYRIWESIKKRCDNKKRKDYKNYWWRWISYDKKRKKFEWFYDDMKEWYSEWLSIDRKNNNWNYCKENCRWTTMKKQNNNRRDNIIIKYLWKKLTVSQRWDMLWLNKNTIFSRIKYWFSVEKILSVKNLKTNCYFKKEDSRN
jgi:hypothetical protein